MILIDKKIILLCCDKIRRNGLMLEKWIKQYLKDDMLEKFIYNTDLWGETPKKYPMFCEVLNKKIQFFKNIF